MKKANVRIELKRLPPHADRRDRDKNLQRALRELKKECSKVMQSYKEHEFYTRPGDYQRRKEARRRQLQQLNNLGIEKKQEEEREWY